MPVPASPSRRVLMTGIAAPTAASKFNAPPCFSAAFASRSPCLAIKALLAVTTDLPDFSAASIADSAGSPEPPINSTKQSMLGSLANASGLLAHSMPRRSILRFFTFERAVPAGTCTPRPPRADKVRPCCSIRRTTSAPTVPSPAMPTFRGATMTKKTCRRNFDRARSENGRPFSESRLAPIGERNHVVQRFNAAFKETPYAARGLADTLLVFHHRDADIAFAVFAEGDAGRNHHAGLLHHPGRELHAADLLESFRQRRPGKHRGLGRRNIPARTAKRFHQRVAALAVGIAHFADAIVGPVQRRGRGDLDRRK